MQCIARTGAEVCPPELEQLPGGQIGRQRLDHLAAEERHAQSGPEPGQLRSGSLHHLLLTPAAGEVGLGWVELVLADAGVDERTLPVHVLFALGEAPAGPGVAARRRRVGTIEPVGQDRFRDVHFDPADRVDELLELCEVDERDVVDVEPCQLLHGLQRQRRAPELERRVDLVRAVARDLDAQITGDREVGDAVLPGVGADEHDRVGMP